jgi:triosephosphate isomerase
VVLRQLEAGLSELTRDAIASMAIAYEPVWAIGTGRTATPADASAVHTAIRAIVATKIGQRASDVPILYGGSVNTGNAKSLLSTPGIDGLLVGGASLDVDGWATICDT